MTYDPNESPDLSGVRRQLDAAAPPMSLNLTADAMTAIGRRSLRRHRIARTALGAVATAVVTALAIVLIGPGAHHAPPPDSTEQPTYPLPSLDPNRSYTWTMAPPQEQTSPTTSNDETRRLVEGMWRALSAPDAAYGVATGPSRDELTPATAVHRSERGHRSEWSLILNESGAEFDYLATVPVYSSGGDGPQLYLTMPGDPNGTGPVATVGVTVWPKGSFPGGRPAAGVKSQNVDGWQPPAPYLEVNCSDEAKRFTEPDYTYDCTFGRDPAGRAYSGTTLVFTGAPDESLAASIQRRVVLYQENGNAVVVEATLADFAGGDNVLDPEELQRVNDFATLYDLSLIASAIPLLRVT